MSGYLSTPCTAFAGTRLLASGALVDVALAIRTSGALDGAAPVLVFDDATGKVGTSTYAARPPKSLPG